MVIAALADDDLMRLGDVCRQLQISRSTLYTMMEGGEIAFVKLGRLRRIKRVDVSAMIEANRRENLPNPNPATQEDIRM